VKQEEVGAGVLLG
jgi:hypothetical protein